MSDSPIFDALNAEQDYTGTMASTRRYLKQSFTSPTVNLGTKRGPIQAAASKLMDEHFDGPFTNSGGVPLGLPSREDEEEVYVKPAGGVPRGTQTSCTPLRSNLLSVMPEIREELGQYTYTPSKDSEGAMMGTYEFDIADRAMTVTFDPGDLLDANISFSSFVAGALKTYREKFPDVEEVEFRTKEHDFELSQEKLFVRSRGPKPPWIGIGEGDHILVTGMGDRFEDPGNAVEGVRQAFEEQHPGHVMVAVKGIQVHDDGSATLKVEGQKLTPVQPLSEKNTAQPME